MELVRWRPMGNVLGYDSGLDRIFDDFFAPAGSDKKTSESRDWQPVVDIFDKDENVVIKADLPGVDKKDIQVDLKGRVLTLSGERSEEKEANGEGYYRKERAYGKFFRSFNLASDVMPDKINATYRNGVLHITIPKTEANKPKQIAIH